MFNNNINNIIRKPVIYMLILSLNIGCMTVISAPVSGAARAKLATKNMSLYIGDKKIIKIKNKSSKCTYTFSSGKKNIASVNKKGFVTGKKSGTSKIIVNEKSKVTKKSRKLGTVTVKVSKKKPDNINNMGNTPAPTETLAPVVNVNVTEAPSISDTAPPSADVSEVPSASPAPESTPLYLSYNFDDGNMAGFVAQGENVRIELANGGVDDSNCLRAANRSGRNNWFGCGMGIEVSKLLQAGKIYEVSCYVMSKTSDTFTLRSVSTGSGGGGMGFSFPSQVGDSITVKAGEWTKIDVIYATPDTIRNGLVLYWDASSIGDIFLDSLEIKESAGMDSTFKDLFSEIFGNVGACNTYQQMRDNKTFTTSLYNSVTMENETKPNTFITGSNFGGESNIADSLPEGYILPESYQDSVYPVLNFETFDNVINTAYEYGFKIRFHVLVWHSQTPEFFFRKNYNERLGYVNADVMDGRMEYYIRNVLHHIYSTPHGRDVVYCIDVANEYFHNYDSGNKSPWNSVYYPEETSASNRTNKPEYIKKAFEIAYDELKYFELEDSVKLFYNDYNTYEVYNDIITMINYINEGEASKICAGVGMQSHLDVGYPAPGIDGKISETIDAFAAQGYEIQITELDVTDYNNSGRQPAYYYDLIYMLVSKKKAGANITGITFWGLCDTNSWRRDGKPLLFSALFCPKESYYKAIDAAKAAWNQ